MYILLLIIIIHIKKLILWKVSLRFLIAIKS